MLHKWLPYPGDGHVFFWHSFGMLGSSTLHTKGQGFVSAALVQCLSWRQQGHTFVWLMGDVECLAGKESDE